MHETTSSSRPATRKLIPFVAALILLMGSVYACSNQGEGDRCDTRNGDEDCLSGLICTSKGTLGTDSDRCCPSNRTQSSADVCRQTATPSGGDASIPTEQDGSTADSATPADSGATTDATDDSAAADASTDSSSDASIADAGVDGQ